MSKRYGYFTGQRVTVTGVEELVFHPRWLMERADNPILRNFVTVHYYDNLLEFCMRERPHSICIFRSHSLGDILMLLPLLRRFRRIIGMIQPIRLVVDERFRVDLALNDWSEIEFVKMQPSREVADYGCDVHMNLNDTVERDHRGGDESNHHRCDIYAQRLGLKLDVEYESGARRIRWRS